MPFQQVQQKAVVHHKVSVSEGEYNYINQVRIHYNNMLHNFFMSTLHLCYLKHVAPFPKSNKLHCFCQMQML